MSPGARLHLVAEDRPIRMQTGFLVEGQPLMSWTEEFEWDFEGEGYLDRSQRRRRSELKMVELAMGMAFLDGQFADAEGKTIRSWIEQRLAMLDDEHEREATREELNDTLRRGFQQGKGGGLDVASIATELREMTDVAERLEAVELCMRVMAADGVVENQELTRVNEVARLLEVDVERFRELRDRVVAFSSALENALDYRELLGIGPNWDLDKIRSHLNQSYSQWNARAEALRDPEKRGQAEKMLEIIAMARSELLDAKP